MEKYGRAAQATDDIIMWCMCSACWITNATDTHSEYVIVIAFEQQQWLREQASVFYYTYIAYLLGVFSQTEHFNVWFALLLYIPQLPGPLLGQQTSYAD